jgi:Tfp pilus assembly protein PilN
MDELATRIPQRVWLRKLSAKGGVLVLEGNSIDAEIVADFAAALEDSPMLSHVDLQETRLEETEGLKLSVFKMTAQYPFLKDAPDPQAKGKKAQRRPGAKPAAGAGNE